MTDVEKPAKAKSTDDLPGIAFSDLREGRCKFPLGGLDEPAERFCGKYSLLGLQTARNVFASHPMA